MKDITKKYTNGEVTIVWKPSLCIHSANCFTGLHEVFHPQELPWITPEYSTTEKIISQVKKCPSGALTYFMNADLPTPRRLRQASEAKGEIKMNTETTIEPAANGPLMVYGDVTVKDLQGNLTKKNKATAFCRCGGSSNKPYCDGTHKKINFQG